MPTTVQSQQMTRRSAIYSALWLGLLLATALSLLSPLTAHAAVKPERVVNSNEAPAPLFDMETEPLFGGTVLEKWSRVQAQIAWELVALDRCHANGACSPDAQRLIDLSAEGAARTGRTMVGLINRAVNLAISPAADEARWGVPDHWSAPFETLRSGHGDCEDYAIVKYLTLMEAGISKDDVKIVILKNAFPKEDHAVVAVRVDHEWLILDNRTLALVRDTDLTRSVPALILGQEGVKRFVSKSRTRRRAG